MLSDSLADALDHRTLAEILRKVEKQGTRGVASRLAHAKGDKDKITAWKQDLLRVLNVFTVRLITSVEYLRAEQSPPGRTGTRHQYGGRRHPHGRH